MSDVSNGGRERKGYEVTERVIEEFQPSCQVGPGCENAWPDSPCCGRGVWREVERTTLSVKELEPSV